MKVVKTFSEWLNEGDSKEGFTSAILRNDILGMKKGDIVKVNALEYTQSSESEQVEIIASDDKIYSVDKKVLDIKI
jgi:hypothetical protein